MFDCQVSPSHLAHPEGGTESGYWVYRHSSGLKYPIFTETRDIISFGGVGLKAYHAIGVCQVP